MPTTTRSTLTAGLTASVTAALASTVLIAAPANAQSERYRDGADTTATPYDIGRVVTHHGDRKLVVKVRVADLRPDGVGSMKLNIDTTERRRRGPEYIFTAGIYDGTDYSLFRGRRWRVTGEPVSCSYRMWLDYERDVVTTKFARACFGGAGRVRVNVVTSDHSDGSHVIRDFAPDRRVYGSWLNAG